MDKGKNLVYSLMFLIFIFGISLWNMITPDKSISESENRPLQQFPKFTWERLASGKFTSEFDEYMADQFVFKDDWVGVKSDVERLLLKGKNNGVYFGKQGYLLEEFLTPGKYFIRNLDSINAFHKKLPYLNTEVMLIPTAVEIYKELLPRCAPTYDQNLMLKQASATLSVDLIDVYSVLEAHKSEYIFYKTDHHWTTLGAFYAYQSLMGAIGEQAYHLEDFNIKQVSDSFYGTYYSKANNHHLQPDSMDIFIPKTDVSFSVSLNGEEVSLDGLYDYNYLNQKDKYSMFLGGNQPLTIVKSSINNGRKLVVFKDSYAHSLVPFLALHFEEIHLIDLRYFNMNPYEYIRDESFDQALFLYNLSTFGSEPNLIKLQSYN